MMASMESHCSLALDMGKGLTEDPNDTHYYDEYDLLIKAVYDYVKKTDNRVTFFHKTETSLMGFKSPDGHFFVGNGIRMTANRSNSPLFNQLIS